MSRSRVEIADEKAFAEGPWTPNAPQVVLIDDVDPKAEQTLVRKLDLAFLPLFTLICKSTLLSL